jgi:NitT/TauT family transport system substrate-binding protein
MHSATFASLTPPARLARLILRLAALPLLAGLAATLLAACTGGATASSTLPSLTIGLTYVPNIQFAPFYVAADKGYYKAAGLNVTFHHHGATEDEFGALVSGKEQVIFAGGDEMLQARSRNVPVVYIGQVYNQYPVALIVPANSPIHSAADLRGHSVGIPGQYGATYIGLLALLQSAGLNKSDISMQSIGFTQVAALSTHKVDAVMGYLNNEPIAFQKAGFAIRTVPVASVQPLVSNGLGALQSELSAHPDQVRAVVKATLQGLAYTIAHPDDALTISAKYVPGLSDATQQANALAVLQASIPLWRSSGTPGYNDPKTWQSMNSFLQAQGQLAAPVDVTQAFSNSYLP